MQFPRLQKRGPIEAMKMTRDAAVNVTFPRLQKRGPIEAGLLAVSPTMKSCFHAYKSVAPLKLSDRLAGGVGELVSTLTKAWPH